jgi:hypothetical protein
MKSVTESCKPRSELLAGSFNPEIFTASLSPVVEFYRTGRAAIDSIYTDGRMFFEIGTYPTHGLRTILNEVFSRVQGDMTVPAIHRLETAFGGGKTHTLIACTHVACLGTRLADVLGTFMNVSMLPNPGEVTVVGIAGDKIPVHKPKGQALVPYTLWGEIAMQVGGEPLYRELQTECESFAAPGGLYFERVLKERKVLIMLDELAQYAARLEAARIDGASQLAAFLFSLHDFARTNPGIAIVLTLASATDAFGRQTEALAKLVSEASGQEVHREDALAVGEKALKPVASVVARDAVQIVPVHASEISSVLASRLLESIDLDAAKDTVEEYISLYGRNSSMLPEEASRENLRERMLATYPFHPTLLSFLNQKLALAENFQGTRGVLRVLALTVRDLWLRNERVPMIHACHINLRSEQVTNEILGRTGSSDLLFVLNADVGGVDTGALEAGQSNAQVLDRANPHPEGYPMHEWTWKTVFLHSLVGRAEGLDSKVMGITEPEALFGISLPNLTPSQVRIALGKIPQNAYYLKFANGRYYADTIPTIEQVLAGIRRSLSKAEVDSLLRETAADIVKADSSFISHVELGVESPEDIPDKRDRLVLGVVSPVAEEIDVQAVFTTKGVNKAREHQNVVLLLVPESVKVIGLTKQERLLDDRVVRETAERVADLARQVKAWRKLAEKPQNYGVDPKQIEKEENKRLRAEREHALHTAMSAMYSSLYYASATGAARREIKSGGGEGGLPFIHQIREVLVKDRKLLTSEDTTVEDLEALAKLFFQVSDWAELSSIRYNFLARRSWPVPDNPSVVDRVIRAGVDKGVWCVYKMGSDYETRPAELYFQTNPVPMGVVLDDSYNLVTVQGARQRGWIVPKGPDRLKVRDAVLETVTKKGSVIYKQVTDELKESIGELAPKVIQDVIASLLSSETLYAGRRSPGTDAIERIDPSHISALVYVPQQDDILATPSKAVEQGWAPAQPTKLELRGSEAANTIVPLLKKIGGLYNRGAKSQIDSMAIDGLRLPHGGTIGIKLSDVAPDSMKRLAELFEVLGDVARPGEDSSAYIRIENPDDSCPLVSALRQSESKQTP